MPAQMKMYPEISANGISSMITRIYENVEALYHQRIEMAEGFDQHLEDWRTREIGVKS